MVHLVMSSKLRASVAVVLIPLIVLMVVAAVTDSFLVGIPELVLLVAIWVVGLYMIWARPSRHRA